jgi:hypothetical protein
LQGFRQLHVNILMLILTMAEAAIHTIKNAGTDCISEKTQDRGINMSGQDLIIEITKLRQKLNSAQAAFQKNGIALAEAEKHYNIAFAQSILMEKDKGTAATLIEKLVKGKPSIAELKFLMDVADVNYRSADKAIDTFKKEIGVVNDQIAREWGKA